jgi:hypothetical protein
VDSSFGWQMSGHELVTAAVSVNGI